ncbi:hypothetical protein J6G99_00550 [bacterium]|nr:hypothetical protein [bacterium]
MSFLALASQKAMLGLQKNFLQLQLTHVQNQVNYYSAEMATIQKQYQADGKGSDYDTDPMYIEYEQLDEALESEKDSIESQLTVIENEISSMKTLVNNNIKASCTLNLASGG